MPPIPAAPTREQGAPSRTAVSHGTPYGTYAIYDEKERATDLRWPRSVQKTYPAMLNDAQIDGMARAMVWAIRAFDYWVEPNGAPQTAIDRVSRNYNLPVGRGTEFNRRRGQRRFSFESHLEDALRGVWLGHYAFEQVFDVVKDGPASVNGGWVAHLRKLAPRPPSIISEIGTAPDGGLEYIKVPAQNPRQGDPGSGLWMRDVSLPVDVLVFYAWDMESPNWRGRSMLRSLYRPWKLKDAVIRDGAINIRRAGGIPYANAPADANQQDRDKILEVLREFRVSDEGAAVFPYGTELKFASAAGGGEAVNYVKLQNEEMARAWLLTFMQLGQTQSGSRALAEPLIDYVQLGQTVIANWFCDTFNEHVIEDDVELNEGPGEEYAPLLRCAPAGDPLEAVGEALEEAQSAGALPVDSQAAEMVRTARGGARGRSGRRPFREGVEAAEDRGELSDAEALVDWDRIDTSTTLARGELVDAWQGIRAEQIDAIAALITAADGDLSLLSTLRAPTLGSGLIVQAMAGIADLGVELARDEAAQQGVTLPDPWDLVEEQPEGVSAALGDFLARPFSRLRRLIEERASAIAETLAGSIGETASRQAVEQTSDSVTPAEVAAAVVGHLEGLTNAFLEEQLGGAIQQGFAAGRRESFRLGPEGATRIEASSLLDQNVCTPCSHADGHVYADLADAERQFPVGGNKDCEGGLRCRCTLVAVYDESPVSVA